MLTCANSSQHTITLDSTHSQECTKYQFSSLIKHFFGTKCFYVLMCNKKSKMLVP